MKNRLILLVFPIVTLILEILPYGAVCNFASGPNETHRHTFSYFDLTPYGYANFAPLLTAIATCAILVVLLIYFFTYKHCMIKNTKILLYIGIILSLCPLLYGIRNFSLVGALITLSLIAELILLFVTYKKTKQNPT
ncbi:MAG: hypothetical protein E7388_02665 [Ruminococcaceae bacterium]|nr:hypothetical protein [Oscillospiraceae bacterium]